MAAKELACGICGRAVDKARCVIIKLSPEERNVLKASGDQDPLWQCVYCRPCHRVLTDPITGPSMFKGLIQVRLRQIGVANAEAIAKRSQTQLTALIDKAKKPKPS